MPTASAADADWPVWTGDVSDDAATIHLVRVPLPTHGVIVPASVPELSRDEIRRAERYLIEAPRRQFVITRLALRRLCGELLSLPPGDIRFEFAQFGKPTITVEQNPLGLTFNVSHSGLWAVIAMGWKRRIGVDVEARDRKLDWRGLAGRFFSADEQRQLAALPETLQPAGFYRIWTGKEAYLKATGLGMSFPLEQFTVAADPRGTPAVLQVQDDPDVARVWVGAAFTPDDNTFGTLFWDNGAAIVKRWTWTAG